MDEGGEPGVQERGLAAAGVTRDGHDRLVAERLVQLASLLGTAEEEIGVPLQERGQAHGTGWGTAAPREAPCLTGPRVCRQLQERPRPILLRLVPPQRLVRALAFGQPPVEVEGHGRAPLDVEWERGGDDCRQVATPGVQELLCDPAETAPAADSGGLADLEERQPERATPAPLTQLARGDLGPAAPGIA